MDVGVGLDFPLAAVVAGEPFGVAATDELVLGGIPFHIGSMPVAKVHEMAGDGAAGTDAGMANGLLAALDAANEVGDLVFADVELRFGIGEEFALG